MKPVKQLVRIKHGSHLYGTNTATSDTDWKGVHLPSGEAIILQRAENHINRNVVSKVDGTDKNAADAVDDESFSVQRFYEMLMKGDTVATEILFSNYINADMDPRWIEVRNVGYQLLNRQCKGFVGYCVRQAAKYGIKGSRMHAVKNLLDMLGTLSPDMTLGRYEHNLKCFVEANEHAFLVNIPSPNGTDMWHIDCVDRKMPFTTTVKQATEVYNRVWLNYGERSRAAMNNEGIDWKAMSHAVRVARQAIELLDTGKITFPRPDAGYLLAVKQGKLPYADVSQQLETLVAMVNQSSLASSLPEKSDHKLADAMVHRLYLEQVQ